MAQQFLASALDSLSANIAILDEAGTIVAVNASWRRFGDENGLNWRDYGVGRNYLAVAEAASDDSDEGALQAAQGIRELIAGQRDQLYLEYPCHSPDKKRWFEMRVTRFRTSEGNWLVLAHEDITMRRLAEQLVDERTSELRKVNQQLEQELSERLRSEEALRESEEKFRDVSEQSPNMIFINIEGRVVYANKKCEEVMGYTREEFYSPDFDFRTLVAPECLDLIEDNFRKHIQGEDVPPYEYALVTKQGKKLDVIITTKLIKFEGKSATLGTITDITTRKQVEEVLRESESRFWDLYHNAPNAYFTVGKDGLIHQCNKRASELLGYPLEKLVGVPVLDLYADTSQGREKAAEVFQRFLAGESITDEELQMQKADGTLLWISLTVNAIRDSEGKILESRSMVVDITERKQAEEALRESEVRLRGLFDTMTEGVVLIAPDGQIIQANPAAERILRLKHPEIEARNYVGPEWEILRPDGTPMPPEEMAGPRAMQEKCPVKGVVMGLRHSDGVVSWLNASASPIINAVGELDGVVGTFSDITERKQAEEALRESEARLAGVLDSALDAIITIDENQKIIRFNPAAEKMFGHTAADVVGSPLSRLIPAQFRAAHADHVRVFARSNVTKRRMGDLGAVSGVRANGEEFPLEVSISQVDVSGQKFLTAIVRDITERKLAEEALRESEETARALLNAPTDSALLVEADGTIIALNETMARRLGHSTDELMGQNIFECFPADLAMSRHIRLNRVVQSGHPTRFEDMREGRWYDNHMYPIFDTQGQVRRVAVYARDITERKRVELVMQEAMEAAEATKYEEQGRRQDAERRRQIAEGLADVLGALNSNQSLEEVLDLIVTQARRLLDTRAVGIYSLEAEVGKLAVEASKGLLITYVAGSNIPIGQETLRQAMVSSQPMAVPDVATFPSDVGDLAVDVRRQIAAGSWADLYQAWLAVPIVSKDEVYGGMLLYYAEPRMFSEDEVELAVAFADQAALAIENSHLRDQIVQAAASAERGRLARDLHDAVTQTLFSASLIAEALPRVWDRQPEQGQSGLEELRQLTRGALAEMRTMLVELRPSALTEKPLGELLRHLTEATTSRTRVPIALMVEGDSSLDPNLQIVLYRIAQEALNNIAKHAKASHVSVDLNCRPERVVLRITDDGRGFDPDDVLPDRVGMGTMRERAEQVGAILDIRSQPGHGTQVNVNWQNT